MAKLNFIDVSGSILNVIKSDSWARIKDGWRLCWSHIVMCGSCIGTSWKCLEDRLEDILQDCITVQIHTRVQIRWKMSKHHNKWNLQPRLHKNNCIWCQKVHSITGFCKSALFNTLFNTRVLAGNLKAWVGWNGKRQSTGFQNIARKCCHLESVIDVYPFPCEFSFKNCHKMQKSGQTSHRLVSRFLKRKRGLGNVFKESSRCNVPITTGDYFCLAMEQATEPAKVNERHSKSKSNC